MAGRPRARVTIVDNVNPANDLCELNIVFHDIVLNVTRDNETCISWLASNGLLRNSMLCVHCNVAMAFSNHARSADGKRWYCKGCKGDRSIRHNSFFSLSRLSLPQLVELCYWWSTNARQAIVQREVGISKPTIIDWFQFIRDICMSWVIDHPVIMGGPGVVVEIDESKFFHRKYHRGHYREGHWVLGIVQRDSTNCVMVEVPDRRAATLLPIIMDHVLPGTRIITDEFASYNQLQNHDAVNHTYNFVHPADPTVHTNTIEGTWGNAKAKYRAMHGTSEALFSSYLQEFLWRRVFSQNIFGNLLYWIRHYYS